MTPQTFRHRSEEPSSRPACAEVPPTPADALVDFEGLAELAVARAAEYQSADPFPHVVIDDFLPAASYQRITEALPEIDDERIDWGNLNADLADGRPAQRYKHHLSNVLYMHPVVRSFFFELNSAPFLRCLETLTGISPLLADPQMKGGGVHLTAPGGVLRVHADFTTHPAYGTDRRLNLLVYANDDWDEAWGGNLELWTRDMSRRVKSLAPTANRCVIFSTTATSFHGHPHPLACPQGRFRKSLAAYYYTLGRPEEDDTPPGAQTLWQDLPSERDGS